MKQHLDHRIVDLYAKLKRNYNLKVQLKIILYTVFRNFFQMHCVIVYIILEMYFGKLGCLIDHGNVAHKFY